ncbi:MAG: cytochrome c, partial [Hyphomonadaceae bacterium]
TKRAFAAMIAGAVIALAACAGQPPAGQAEANGWKGVATPNAELVKAGQEIAQNNCASCHALGASTKSPLADAPPLREVLNGYEDDEVLAYRFIEGMRVGHNEMPLFNFDVRGADALIAYLRSIRS